MIRNTECTDERCHCKDGLILYAEAVCQVQLVGKLCHFSLSTTRSRAQHPILNYDPMLETSMSN